MRSYSDNAVMAKVRAMYGKRLSEQDYTRLLQCKTVGEAAAYLKSDTAYASVLQEVREDLIHRGQLETFVRRRILEIYSRLLKYSYSDTLFFTMYIRLSEIHQLLLSIRLLEAGTMDKYILALPAYLARHTSFDLFALARVSDYDSLLELLEHSEYYGILLHHRPVTSGRKVDAAACERDLLAHYYSRMLSLVRREYRGDAMQDLLRQLRWQVDMHNISVIYRLKRFFQYPPDRIRQHLLDVRGVIPSHMLDALINAPDAQALLAILQKYRPTARYAANALDAQQVLVGMEQSMRRLGQRTFRFSSQPVVVVVSFMYLLEMEVRNIIQIVEGIRYGIAPEEIRRLLVY